MAEAARPVPGHSQGFHPFAGHGLPDDQRAIARLGLDGAHVRADAAECRTSLWIPRASATTLHDLGAVDAVERVRIELRLDVRDARDFDERPQPTSERFFAWYAQSQFEDWWRDTAGLDQETGPDRGESSGRTEDEPGAWCRKTFRIKKVAVAEQRRDRRIVCESNSTSKFPRRWSLVLPPPPVRGVGRAGGFKIMIEDRSSSAGSLEGSHARGMRRTSWSTRRNSILDPETGARTETTRVRSDHVVGLPRQRAAGLRRSEPKLGDDQGSPAATMSSRCCRSTWDRSMSMISTCSAAPGR